MDTDPYLWTISDVQDFFRNHAKAILHNRPSSQLPPIEPFLSALYENDVDGATLFENIDNASLRDDLGVHKLGCRGTVLYCINKLKSTSVAYNGGSSSTAVQLTLPAALKQVSSQLTFHDALSTPTANQVLPLATDEPPQLQREGFTQTASGISERDSYANEREVTDVNSRKRRRIQPLLVKPVPNIESDTRVDEPHAKLLTGHREDAAINLDELFFGKAEPGQDLFSCGSPRNSAVRNPAFNLDPDDDSFYNFEFDHITATSWQSAFVYDQIKHLLANRKEVSTERRGRSAIAVAPYRELCNRQREGLKRGARSTIVYQYTDCDDEPHAIRELEVHLHNEISYGLADNAKEDELSLEEIWADVDGIEQRHGSPTILPLWDPAELDDAMSLSSSDEDNDMEDDKVNSRLLSSQRVTELIDGRIGEFVADWHKKLPRLEAKSAWTVWKKTAQRHSIRDALIKGANDFIAALDRRLSKMREKLLESDWESENAVLKACENLEPTVEDREHQRWMIDVWMRRQEPGRIPKRGITKPRLAAQGSSHTSRPRADDHISAKDRFSISPAPYIQTGEIDEQTYPVEDVAMSNGLNGEDRKLSYEGDHEDNDTSDEEQMLAVATGDGDEEPTRNDFPVQTVESDSDAEMHSREPQVTAFNTSESPLHSPESDHGSLPSMKEFASSTQRATRLVSNAVIDLTYSSDTQIQSPSRRPPSKPVASRTSNLQGDPFHATVTEVATWNIHDLAKANDKQRLMTKLLSEVGPSKRDLMHTYVQSSAPAKLSVHVRESVQSLQNGILPEPTTEHDLARVYCTTVYLAWLISVPAILDWALKSPMGTTIPGLQQAEWTTAMEPTQTSLFVAMLDKVLKLKQSRLFLKPPKLKHGSPSNALLIESSDEAIHTPRDKRNAEGIHSTPHKKRKRAVQANPFAAKSRRIALDRQERYDALMYCPGSDPANLVALIETNQDDTKIEINPARNEGEDPIYISAEIAKCMKPHQIEGIRFLWRETTTVDSEEGNQGCILAHTMGLGKTMQTLALLIAIDEAARSKNSRIATQLPLNLRLTRLRPDRRLRMLILCPPALMQNWRAEIEHWVPRNLWQIFSYESGKSSSMLEVERWVGDGGILLLGYQMFRAKITRKEDKSGEAKRKCQVAKDNAFLEDAFLLQSDVVVADEAHYIKNDRSGVGMAASRFTCPTRIALTGTPMSNDVQEIYSLVSWVAPGYLGDSVEFRAHYAEPIKEGLYFDSSHYEKRKSIKKLKVLHHTIGPKVSRATIEALRGSLKPKVEFVITVPLTPCQMELYTRFVRLILRDNDSYIASLTKVWGWLAVLTLLTNHPYCFREKLLAPPPKQPPRKNALHHLDAAVENADVANVSSGDNTPTNTQDNVVSPEGMVDPELEKEFAGDQHVRALGLTSEMVDEILGDMHDSIDLNPELSAKITVFNFLLEQCLQCKDKVLVFSTSIPTLKYLDNLFRKKNLPFGCIKGSTPIKDRPQILENFHNDIFDVMLISTRAGSVGLNIQGANRVFILDFSFNPSWEDQAVGRAYRIGQTKPVFVYRFVADGTFERNIYNTQLFKSSLTQRVVDKKNPRRATQRKTRDWLYEPSEPTQQDISEWLGKDKMVLDRLISQHGPGEEGKFDSLIRDIKTMETLQEEAQDAPLNVEEQAEVDQEIAEGRGRRSRKLANTF